MALPPIAERNQDATIYVGGLDEKVSENILWEMFLQAGPIVTVHMPKDRITLAHQGYGFVEFLGEEDADYAIKIMNMIKLYGKPIRVNKASAHQKNLDVGANVFIGNLDPEVDEKLLYDTFSAFGVILQTPKIMRDPETGNSKGFAFINFASFEASDASIEAMNGQYLCNRAISVSYAFKKDSKGERHGSAAERLLAVQNPLTQTDRPHQLFADAPPPSMPAPPLAAPLPPMMMPGMPPIPPMPGMPMMPPMPPGGGMPGMHPMPMPPGGMPGMPPHGMPPFMHMPGMPGMSPFPPMPPMFRPHAPPGSDSGQHQPSHPAPPGSGPGQLPPPPPPSSAGGLPPPPPRPPQPPAPQQQSSGFPSMPPGQFHPPPPGMRGGPPQPPGPPGQGPPGSYPPWHGGPPQQHGGMQGPPFGGRGGPPPPPGSGPMGGMPPPPGSQQSGPPGGPYPPRGPPMPPQGMRPRPPLPPVPGLAPDQY